MPNKQKTQNLAGRAATIETLRGSITDIINGNKRTHEKRNNDTEIERITSITAHMIRELHEKMSGTASEGEQYTFALGKDAVILRRIKNRIIEGQMITKEDAKQVLGIYKKFFPKEAEKIKI